MEQTSGPDVAAKGITASKVVGSESTFTFTIPVGADTQTLAFRVTVADNAGVESTQSFDMSVNNTTTSTFAATEDDGSTSNSSGGRALNPFLILIGWVFYLGLTKRWPQN